MNETPAVPPFRDPSAVRLVLGVVVIVVGILFTLDNFDLFPARYVFRLWPLALVAVGVVRLRENRGFWSGFWSSVLVFVGAAFLLRNFDVVRVPLDKMWPLVLVGVGVSLVQKAMGRGPRDPDAEASTAVRLQQTSVFGGRELTVATDDFRGGTLNAVFGGFGIDLRRSRMVDDRARIEVFVLFGGGELYVPPDWNVSMKAFALFGGVDDQTVHPLPGSQPTPRQLDVTGLVLFGGMDVKN